MKSYCCIGTATLILIILSLFTSLSPGQVYHQTVEPDDLFAMSLRQLMDVELEIVTAGKIPEKIAEIPASVVLIERSDIEASGFRTLAEVLSHIPGLYPVDDYSWGGICFGVRGFWTGVANRNLIILINGVNQLADYESNFALNKINVPVEAIDRIEVVRGPMSVIYGTGAFFGVINIITNEISEDRPVRLVSASYGMQNTSKAVLRIADKTGDFQYVLNASLYKTDGPDVPYHELVRDTAAFRSSYFVRGDQRTKNQLDNAEKYINFSGKSDRLFFDFSFCETNKGLYLTIPSFSDGSYLISAKTNTAIGYQWPVSEQLSVFSKLSYHHCRYRLDMDIYKKNFDMEQTLGEAAYEFEANLHYRPNEAFDLLAGFSNRTATEIYNIITAPSLGDPNIFHTELYLADQSKLTTRAFFVQTNLVPRKRVKIVCGLRFEQTPEYTIGFNLAPQEAFQPATVMKDDYRYDDWEIIPRVALLYNISKSHIIKFLYGQAINRPSFQQNADIFLGVQGDLVPEKIRTYEMNYLGTLLPGFSAGINVFRNELSGLLIRDHGLRPDSTYYSFFSNAGGMNTHGAEMTVIIEPVSERLLVEASVTYQKSRDKRQPDIDIAYSPNWLGYLKAVWRPGGHLTCSLTARYVDRMLAYRDPVRVNADGSAGGRIGDSARGYTSLGANVRADALFGTGLYLNIRGANLLNTKITYPAFTNNAWADRGTLGEPQTFLLTLGMKY